MYFPEMLYTIDILFVVVILFFAISGTRHGFSGELAHVVLLLALLIGVCFFYPRWIQMTSDSWRELPMPVVQISVSVALLLIALLFFVFAHMWFRRSLEGKLGGGADKMVGGLIGALRGGLFGLAVWVGLSLIPNDSLYRVLSEQSLVGNWVCNTLTPWVQPRIKELPILKDRLSEPFNDVTP